MEPDFVTDGRLRDVLEELVRREPLFHRPEFGTARADFEAMTVPDFWETGASGRRYSRAHVLDVLEQRYREPVVEEWAASDFWCRELADGVYLLTYTLVLDGRRTRRVTVWQRDGEVWRIVYHQGTPVSEF